MKGVERDEFGARGHRRARRVSSPALVLAVSCGLRRAPNGELLRSEDRAGVDGRPISSKLVELAQLVENENAEGGKDDDDQQLDSVPEAQGDDLHLGSSPPPAPASMSESVPDPVPDILSSTSLSLPSMSAVPRPPVDIGRISPAPTSPELFASEPNQSPASFLRTHTSPLDEVEDALCNWCTNKSMTRPRL